MFEFYAVIKDAIANDTDLGNTILHIHGGMLVFLLSRLISGRSIGTFLPFAAVLTLELLNEGIDRINHGGWRWNDTVIDLASTLFWPFVLSLAVRFRPDRRYKRAIYGYRAGGSAGSAVIMAGSAGSGLTDSGGRAVRSSGI